MPEAARVFDPVAHTQAITGIVAGALIGAAIVLTGGAALLAVAVAAAAGGILEVLGTLSFVPTTVTGAIITGSPNVQTNSRAAARAHLDTDNCAGMPPFLLPPHVPNPLAQGSKTVLINGWPAARKGDLTVCGAKIYVGSDNVRIGGPPATTDKIQAEVPSWIDRTLLVAGFAASAVLFGPVIAVFGLAGGMLGGYGGALLGSKLFGQGSDGQKLMMLGGAILGGWGAAKGAVRPAAWLGGKFSGPTGAFVRGGVSEVIRTGVLEQPSIPTSEVRSVRIKELKYSQGSVSGSMRDGRSIDEVANDMAKNGWDSSKDPPDVVMRRDGSLTTLDHRRVVAADRAGLDEIPANVHPEGEPIDPETAQRFRLRDGADFTDPDTGKTYEAGDIPENWGEAATFRSANQRVMGYPEFPLSGSPDLPEVLDTK